MRKLLIIALALSLTACSNLKNAWEVATTASVSPTAVYVAANTFDALEATATNYLRLPKCGATNTKICRDQNAVAAIIPAIRSGRVARTNLEQFLKTHPGQLGPQGLYDALTASITTIQNIYAQYNIGKGS